MTKRRLRLSRIVMLSCLLASAVTGYLFLSLRAASFDSLPLTCTAIPPDIHLIGSPLTLDQVEQASLAEMRRSSPDVPKVPFGYLHKDWLSLKEKIEPGDQLFAYSSGASGGHIVIRNRCVIGQIVEWIT